ncbi:hypothetical protein [Vibrio parahaemolyticus]|uniref:hypothetical protein n=1 Tax=Vibrio parahaemolyticus TaxID=670 RepID=UPI0011213AFD|nr:hypothetical protein [Vibrio parahaemolyticus]TOM08329.1 hypothetical protein CGH83_23775 [Vibrio parahaemolyticus]TOM27545.1 hypothetical protein CGH80_24230 [Vibrio parahaemolyticus]TOM38047.1 hypothetical protein CGH77_23895 [Vibrio parahaemolyticus]
MDNARIIISRLKEWARSNQVPITQELNQIDRKLAEFYKCSTSVSAKNLTQKQSSKKPKIKRKPKTVVNNLIESCLDKINFNIKKVIIPVKGSCHFCKVKGISQDAYKLTNNQTAIVCSKCAKKQRKINSQKNKVIYVDAMERLVPGSYGSGKKAR